MRIPRLAGEFQRMAGKWQGQAPVWSGSSPNLRDIVWHDGGGKGTAVEPPPHSGRDRKALVSEWVSCNVASAIAQGLRGRISSGSLAPAIRKLPGWRRWQPRPARTGSEKLQPGDPRMGSNSSASARVRPTFELNQSALIKCDSPALAPGCDSLVSGDHLRMIIFSGP
jgi:hypothetical protein